MTAPTLTLADALAAQSAAPLPPMPGTAPALPPMPVAPPAPPPIVLTPELEAWAAGCIAAGHDPAVVRATAEAAMKPPTAITTPAAPQAQAPIAVSSATPLAQPTATGVTHSVVTDLAAHGGGSGAPAPSTSAEIAAGLADAATATVAGVLADAPSPRRGRPPKAAASSDMHMVAAVISAGITSVGATPAQAVTTWRHVLAALEGV